jgi:hypothetical protein
MNQRLTRDHEPRVGFVISDDDLDEICLSIYAVPNLENRLDLPVAAGPDRSFHHQSYANNPASEVGQSPSSLSRS